MAPQAPSTERRRARRIDDSFAATLQDGDQTAESTIRNISASGAYCTVNRFIAPMTKIQVRFNLPDSDPSVTIDCVGVVVRVTPRAHEAQQALYDIAIFFSDISSRQQRQLKTYVEERMAD